MIYPVELYERTLVVVIRVARMSPNYQFGALLLELHDNKSLVVGEVLETPFILSCKESTMPLR